MKLTRGSVGGALLLRLAVVMAIVLLTGLSWRAQRYPFPDPGNPCGVDRVSISPFDRDLVHMTYAGFPSGDVSFSTSSVTMGTLAKSLATSSADESWFEGAQVKTESDRSDKQRWIRYRLQHPTGALRSLTYSVRVLEGANSARVSLVVVPRTGARVSSIRLATSFDGFDLYLPSGRRLHNDGASREDVDTNRNWAVLTRGRCAMIAWAPRLAGISTSWRFSNIAFEEAIGSDGRAALNFKFLYGVTVRSERGRLRFVGSDYARRAEEFVRALDRKHRSRRLIRLH